VKQLGTPEASVQNDQGCVISAPVPGDWEAYLESGAVASDEFMENVDDLPVQERE